MINLVNHIIYPKKIKRYKNNSCATMRDEFAGHII